MGLTDKILQKKDNRKTKKVGNFPAKSWRGEKKRRRAEQQGHCEASREDEYAWGEALKRSTARSH